MEKYYIAFYTNKDNEETRGDWKRSEEALEVEKEKYEKVPHLRMRQTKTAAILVSEVEKLAKEHKMTHAEVLSCM